jgi:hypothetical protein
MRMTPFEPLSLSSLLLYPLLLLLSKYNTLPLKVGLKSFMYSTNTSRMTEHINSTLLDAI